MKHYPFGQRLQDLRESRNLTRKDLAKRLGASLSKIGHLETGARNVSVPDAVKLANILGVTLDELIPVNEQGDFVEPREQVPA